MKHSITKYNYLNNYIKKLWVRKELIHDLQKHTLSFDTRKKFLCLSTQFYCLIKLPNLEDIYFSPNSTKILGINHRNITLLDFFKLVDSKYHDNVIDNYFKIFDHVESNLHNKRIFKCLSTINFYIKNAFDEHLNLLQQTCIYNTNQQQDEIILLLMFTDISSFQTHYSSNSSINSKVANPNATNLFTKRELEIIELLSDGKNSQQIASDLCISKHTVDTHRRKMLSKSELGNTAELIAYTYL